MKTIGGVKLEVTIRGHVLNPLWLSRERRREIRGQASHRAVISYLSKYSSFAKELSFTEDGSGDDVRNVFTLWLQGKDRAPDLVRACWRSMEDHCGEHLHILDGNTVLEMTDLPGFVVDKWRSGRMRPAHFADICRLDLICRHGGLWLDSTDFIPAPLPEWLWQEPFFIYMSGSGMHGSYSFVQNCFIRARKNTPLAAGWLALVLEHWRREDSLPDYFTHQMLFEEMILSNPAAAEAFERMPKIAQNPTHLLWYGHATDKFNKTEFDAICRGTMFQKTDYKTKEAVSPPSGSIAEALIKGLYR